MSLRPIAAYVRALKPALPAAAFAPARSRLAWLPVHLAIIAVATLAIARAWVPWFVVPALSLVIGVAFAGLTFLGHETLHGAIVRGKLARRVVGFIGFLPFTVSPRLWVAWHNRSHHGHTNEERVDPDVYPTLAQYRDSGAVRAVTDHFSLGGGRLRGLASVLFGYTGQSVQILIGARRSKMLGARDHRLAIVESLLGVAVWTTLAILVGPLAFGFVFVLPLIVANAMVMTYILTNHSLSPLTATNDPLANSLSVTVPRWYEWITLGFGHHVEHHIFPSMSTRHAPLVRAAIRARWPESYQAMPLGEALGRLHRTARVYQDAATLVEPHSGRTWPTLRTRAVAPTPAT